NSTQSLSGAVATDPTGTGAVYQYVAPTNGGATSNFFQINGVGQTNGLGTGNAAWPNTGVFNTLANVPFGDFAVNPINNKEILISSAQGRVFLTTDGGLNWDAVGDPGVTGGVDTVAAPALAFGAPDPASTLLGTANFLYAGTLGGRVFVTS